MAALALIGLLAIAPAPAHHYLPRATARRVIIITEREYWGAGVHVSVGRCRRHSPVQITCTATATQNGIAEETTDWATRLGDGLVRVRPAASSILTVEAGGTA
jgi:hypothetical protein